MTKLKRFAILTLSSLLVMSLCGACGKDEETNTSSKMDVITVTPEISDSSSEDATDSASSDEDAQAKATETPSHEGMVRSRLTN